MDIPEEVDFEAVMVVRNMMRSLDKYIINLAKRIDKLAPTGLREFRAKNGELWDWYLNNEMPDEKMLLERIDTLKYIHLTQSIKNLKRSRQIDEEIFEEDSGREQCNNVS